MRPTFASTMITLPLVLLLGLATTASAAVKNYTFIVDGYLGDAFSPDCQNVKTQGRWLFLVNGTMPGPTIEATEGDTIFVEVINHHPTMETSIHWHGLWQKGLSWHDGPAGVTQCGLGPGQSQVYELLAYPAGTHYWHAHLGYNLADGQAGPIVVHPKTETLAYNSEQTVMFQDFYIRTGSAQAIGLLSNPFVWIGNPDTILVNGKGVADKCLTGGSSFNDTNDCRTDVCAADDPTQYETIEFIAGETKRLRFITSTQLVGLNVAIANHTMRVVALDGAEITPVTVDNLDLAPGQRVDVLVTADQTAGNYWLETSVRGRNIGTLGRAIIQYSTATLDYPPDSTISHPTWDEQQYQIDVFKHKNVSAVPEQLPALSASETNITRYVLVGTQNFAYSGGARSQLVWAMNNISHVKSNDHPLIFDAVEASRSGWPAAIPGTVDMPQTPPNTWNYSESVYNDGGPGEILGSQETSIARFTQGQVIEFVLQNALALNGAAELHPWHLHGHSFWVIGRGQGVYDPATDPANYNLVNPPLRDTVSLWGDTWVAIRFVADNPGVWRFHCHMLSHLLMGMGFDIVTSPDKIGEPSDSVNTCASNDLNSFTFTPTNKPSASPSKKPSGIPSGMPSKIPSDSPSAMPSSKPSSMPIKAPTDMSSTMPTAALSATPTSGPTSPLCSIKLEACLFNKDCCPDASKALYCSGTVCKQCKKSGNRCFKRYECCNTRCKRVKGTKRRRCR
jgi:L-ascorbate oxidase